MRTVIFIALSALLAFAGLQIWRFEARGRADEARLADIRAQFERASAEYEELRSDLEYFKRPENLEKELRARFNYRGAGEKLIIVVPGASSASSASSTAP